VSDVKLFRTTPAPAIELHGSAVSVEKSLQTLIEANLDVFLGVRFLATEYSTGKSHAGRIDTLGLDENNSPVIIEYKRSTNQNVINQGLFYLDWLLDHRAEFVLLAMQVLGPAVQDAVEWTAPRLLCIARDFTRYDEHAVQQIDRNIELIRYRRYGEELLLLELLNASRPTVVAATDSDVAAKPGAAKMVVQYLAQSPPELHALYDSLEAYLMSLGDDVQKKETKVYIAFRRLKNFACIEVHPQAGELLCFVKVDPDEVVLEPGFSRDVRNIGHFGTGDLELRLKSPVDLDRAKPLLDASYARS
jgi:predicted transport protein